MAHRAVSAALPPTCPAANCPRPRPPMRRPTRLQPYYRWRRQQTPTTVTSLAPYTMRRRASYKSTDDSVKNLNLTHTRFSIKLIQCHSAHNNNISDSVCNIIIIIAEPLWVYTVHFMNADSDIYRVTTHLENLEKSGNSKVVREKSGKMEKVREKSGKLTFVSSCNQYTSNTNRLSVKAEGWSCGNWQQDC